MIGRYRSWVSPSPMGRLSRSMRSSTPTGSVGSTCLSAATPEVAAQTNRQVPLVPCRLVTDRRRAEPARNPSGYRHRVAGSARLEEAVGPKDGQLIGDRRLSDP